jgi:hypothetical protein
MKKLPLSKIAADAIEFADDNGFDAEVSGNRLLVFLNGTQKAFSTVSEFIRAMFAPKQREQAFKEWSLHFDRAVYAMRNENQGTTFHQA